MRPPGKAYTSDVADRGKHLYKQQARPVQIFWRIHAQTRRLVGEVHRDSVAVPQRAQLFQRLQLLKWRRSQGWELPQKTDAIGIDSHVAQRPRQIAPHFPPCGSSKVSGRRNW